MRVEYFKKIAIGLILLIFGIQATYAQNSNINKVIELKRILYNELAKALPKDKLPAQESIQLMELSSSETGKYVLTGKPIDAFYINATSKKLFITGTSAEGIRNGIFWYLHHLGFRYYFPNENWHFSPKLATAFKPLEIISTPSFLYRRIWYAYGTGSKKADEDYKFWSQANLQGGEEVNAGHAYDGIVRRNQQIFLEHPEYFAQKVAKGKIPGNPKFNVDNVDLVELCIQDAFRQIEDYRKKTGSLPNMISMDPSDGGGYATSQLGKPNEQVFYLANRVAKAVHEKYKIVKIGLYAYNFHAAPPKFELEPNIVVLVATAFNRSSYRTDELIDAWKKKGIDVGIRDYFGVMEWDWDMPGKVRGGKIAYVKLIKKYYKEGVRYFTAETNIGWISRGLGHYIGACFLWDINADEKEISKEFYKNMFGNASKDMEKLFEALQDYPREVPLEGDLHQWSKWIEEAAKAESDEKVQKRVDQVKQYLHYVVLFKKWKEENSDANLISLLNYAYRVQDDGIVASYPLFRSLANSAVAGKANMRFNDPNAVWKKNGKAIGREEIDQDFYKDLKAFNTSQRTVTVRLPDQFKQKTKEAKRDSPVTLSSDSNSSLSVRLRGSHKIVFQVQGVASINLSAGLIKTKNFKTLRLSVFEYNPELNTDGEAVMNETVVPRQPLKAISLNSLKSGTYIALIDDAKQGFTMSFSGSVSYAIVAGNLGRIWTFARNNLVFDVGEVKEFQLQNEGALTLISPTGRVIDMQKQRGNFTIKVEKGEEGVWKMKQQSGVFYISGLIPFVSPDQLFLLRAD